MCWRNSHTSYGRMAKILHWLVAVCIIGLLICGFLMDDVESPLRETIFMAHKLTGLFVLCLMIVRATWKVTNPSPEPVAMPWWMRLAAASTHGLLYVVAILQPLSGWIMSTAVGHVPKIGSMALPFPGVAGNESIAELADATHYWVARIIVALLVAHIGAAFYHQYIRRDNLLFRMLPANWK